MLGSNHRYLEVVVSLPDGHYDNYDAVTALTIKPDKGELRLAYLHPREGPETATFRRGAWTEVRARSTK